jgi:hypothetical protein
MICKYQFSFSTVQNRTLRTVRSTAGYMYGTVRRYGTVCIWSISTVRCVRYVVWQATGGVCRTYRNYNPRVLGCHRRQLNNFISQSRIWYEYQGGSGNYYN